MSEAYPLSLFAACAPGMERSLAMEAREIGFGQARAVPGGAVWQSNWPGVWKANLRLSLATRVLLRIDAAEITHLSDLEKWLRKLPWQHILPQRPRLDIEASATRSKIYHTGAIASRLEKVLKGTIGAEITREAEITVLARMERDWCTISLDTSGEPLYKRGFKQQVNKAPLRETLAAGFLRDAGYRGDAPLLDPMCGSGTFLIEAAQSAMGLAPGRARPFAFQFLPSFDAGEWEALRRSAVPAPLRDALQSAPDAAHPAHPILGFDRDAGAVAMTRANLERAGLDAYCTVRQGAISALERPQGAPGLVIVNPPYGARISAGQPLGPLYRAFGEVMRERFSGWRVALLTSEEGLARACALPWKKPGPPIPHGPLRIQLYQTGVLA
ncbi:MAG: class I SAM-dependent RNA methyltransferase [Neomegalonema sp.]|nr:class I SAM-dependent RNA methyltransferase [Neomegalonema sp.]